MKMPATRAVLYARVSSKDQEREGFSIPAQEKLLRQYAREHGITIAREFVDVETAKQVGRTGFGAMLAFLRSDPSCRVQMAASCRSPECLSPTLMRATSR